jgi:uncharacterized protein (DUF1810 family)
MADVLAELGSGQKRTHWMWFIFPQIAGLGQSPTARLYAIASAQEARAYLSHPVLGERLKRCCEAVLAIEGRSAREIFGEIDALKLRSSMTLFARVSGEPVFRSVLAKLYAGREDPATLELLDTVDQDPQSADQVVGK